MARMVQIDGEKLNDIIRARGLKSTHISRELGFNNAYIKHCVERNTISTGAQKMLATMFGIMPGDYEYTEQEPEPEPVSVEPEVIEQTAIEEPQEPEKPGVVALDMEQFQRAVALALGNMKTDYDALRAAIREGILDALTAAMQDSDTRYMISGLLINSVAAGLAKNIQDKYRGLKGGK